MIKKVKVTIKRFRVKGFTLIELLVSMGLFAAVSGIIVSVLFSAFRASKKAETIIAVKERGNAALSQMVSSIRYAKTLDDPISCVIPVEQDSLIITGLDNGQTTYSCPDYETTYSISSNSATLISTDNLSVDACSFTCSQLTMNDSPTILIKFILNTTTGTAFGDTQSTIPFQTTVVLRNYP